MATLGSGQQQAYGVSTAPSDVLTPDEQAKAAQRQGTSGFFNKVSDFLKANQGSDFAGQIASNVSGKVGSVSGESTKAKEAFQTEAEKGRSQFDEATSKKVIEGAAAYDPNKPVPSYVSGGTGEVAKAPPIGLTNIPASAKVAIQGAADTGMVKQSIESPAATLDEASKQAATRMLSGSYSGPMDVQGAQALQAKAEDVSRLASGFTSGTSPNASAEASRFASLSRLFGSPTYVPGQQKLDALLLTSPQAQQRLAQLRTTGVQGLQGVQSDIASARQSAAQYGQEAGATKKAFLGNITGAISDIDKQAQDAADAQAKANAIAYANAQSELSGDEVSSAYAPLLSGIQSGQNLYNLKLTDYLQKAEDPTKQQAIQLDQLQRLRGLGTLAATDISSNPEYAAAQKIAQSDYDTSKIADEANIARAKTMGFDTSKLQSDARALAKQQQKLQSEYQDLNRAYQNFDTGRLVAPEANKDPGLFGALAGSMTGGGVVGSALGYGAGTALSEQQLKNARQYVFDSRNEYAALQNARNDAMRGLEGFNQTYNPNRKLKFKG